MPLEPLRPVPLDRQELYDGQTTKWGVQVRFGHSATAFRVCWFLTLSFPLVIAAAGKRHSPRIHSRGKEVHEAVPGLRW